MNLSLQSVIFANEWKLAILRPLIKKQNCDLVKSNYRPVSNIPFMAKVAEKVALTQLNEFSSSNHASTSFQLDYKAGYSCETAILKIINDSLWSLESQKVTTLVLIDISATFDTVDHETLLETLCKTFGLTGTIMDWFTSHLHDHKCKVCVGKEYPDIKTFNFSVQQGGILSPTLFNCYSSTISSMVLTDNGINAFADDHSLQKYFIPGGSDGTTSKTNLEQTWKSVCDWMNGNRFKINYSKTEFIILGSRKHLEKCQIKSINVCSTAVPRSIVVRYLGAWCDKNLNFKHHVDVKCKSTVTLAL